VDIMEKVPGVISIESAKMLQVQRGQIVGLISTVLGLMGLIWLLSVVFIGLVFAVTVHSRRRQIGVMRALGATSPQVVRSLLLEGVVLGLGGGIAGITVSALLALSLGAAIAGRWGLPFKTPSPLASAALAAGGLALALASVGLGALLPALHISRQEPAQVMRE
jgi:putative ABC transport system permease protein